MSRESCAALAGGLWDVGSVIAGAPLGGAGLGGAALVEDVVLVAVRGSMYWLSPAEVLDPAPAAVAVPASATRVTSTAKRSVWRGRRT
jgi:hypothetical protein